MKSIPKLVQDDPWLVPQTDAIQRRIRDFQNTLDHIRAQYGSLAAYATGHKQTGIHYQPREHRWIIREWAPGARAISLIGDFNVWDREAHPLRASPSGVWELQLDGDAMHHGQLVKLHIHGADGSRRDRIPACIRRCVQDETTHDYSGQIWRAPVPYSWKHVFDPSTLSAPMIYEAHAGMAGEEPRVHTYREFADHILPRVLGAGYNSIQLMAVQEHPYYGSFGYHVSSFFAPCSRFGTPEDLKYLVDTAHGLGIAVLLDIVHSHAVKNMAEGINDFDGSGGLYFHPGPRGDHPNWDSKCFDYGRPEVRQFLLSNVRYWIEEFRFDGFRFDGVTSMLYHSRGNRAFGSYEDYFGQDADVDAILYLQLATTLARELKPGVILVAEDMSGMPGLCRPVDEGGIGFSHRLAMGIPDHWIKLLKHSRDEEWNLDELWGVLSNRRSGEATIAYAESHDQALVGDKTIAFWLMDKEMYWHMAKSDDHPVIERGIALHKMIRLITLAVGGEGWLNFMGNEFGHPEWLDFPREGNGWSYHYCRRQWSLAENPDLKYHWLLDFDRSLLDLAKHHHLLLAPPAQSVWVDRDRNILCFERANLLFVFNFSVDRSFPDFEVPSPGLQARKIALDTDDAAYGGHARVDHGIIHQPADGGAHIRIYSPSRSAQVYVAAEK